ncbi:glycosyltransferase family 4 protein [Subsaxibacter sp. CAU 1640]|uniref:glycosyltransferase family 4 protein n=1 Tax=Subsaxibacter sp. CAU 1640 TaxID=2933271 RepID=UPI0020056F7F|nr:glycosyltransferase family 4 protein [Subsaxibacter sp. CAU 1640]MCK7591717.1 glycosyltransferase family 4 protein [Subsaxibacter sp. CAU 1640]
MSLYKDFRLNYKNKQLKNKLMKEGKILDFNTIDFSKKNVLVVDSIIPEYDRDSGSRRLHELIKLMLKNGFRVFLVADKKEYKYKTDYVSYYNEMGVVTYEPCIDEDGNFVTRDVFIERILQNIQFAWLHRADMFYKYHDQVSKHRHIKLIYDMVDFHYLRLDREWQLNKNPKVKKEADKYLNIETENCKNADAIIAISDADKQALKTFYSDDRKVITISNVHQYRGEAASFYNREGLLFVGGFSHTPNQDAVLFLHEHIVPLLWERQPDLVVNIIGSYPTKEVLALNAKRFKVHGFVDDISGYFRTSKVFVAPLRYGAGVKGKIGQSLEFGLPVVTTFIGAEGFDFGDNENHCVDNTPQGMADKILKLYNEDSLWQRVSDASEDILEPFSLKEIESRVLKLLS